MNAFARRMVDRCGVALLCLTVTGMWTSNGGSRLIKEITFEQPNGTVIDLRGEGNEYHARYETLDGYTVVFVPEERAYFYAKRSEDGDELISSGLRVGEEDPASFGLAQGIRINTLKAQQDAARKRHEGEIKLRLRERWEKLKKIRSGEIRATQHSPDPTLGTKIGLTLLIDFDDTHATVPRSNVVEYLNGDNYRSRGNRGSVKEYFRDVSGGKLLYTNVVIGYVRIPAGLHPREYYDDLNRVTWDPVNELIRDAITILTNQPSYLEEVVPQLEALSENEAGEVLALNVFVAGSNSGVWAKGLWPHMSSLYAVGPQELWPGGKKVNLYQMTTMESLTISTFCHETGHLLCGFPDVYDYDSQSFGGAGLYCVMAYEASATNPQHPCGYLKLVAGWATVTELRAGAAMTVALPAPSTNGTHLLRYSSPASHEYYVIENRLKTGRDAEIPGSGILVWHVDELGNNSDENLLPNAIHANYEVALMQADGQWNLQRNQNAGDPNDPFYRGNSSAGYRNRFADDTNPSASWWTGWRSGLELRDFSRLSNSMTLTVEVKSQDIARDPMSQTVILGDDLFLSVQVTLNQPLTYAWYKGNAPVTENERVAGVDGPVLSISGMTQSDSGGYSVVITDSLGQSRTSRVAQVTTSNQRRLSAADLGDAGRVSGTTAVLNNVYRMSAGGSGVAGAADGARFLHEAISGNFDAKLQVVDMNPEDFRIPVSGAAGIMVRSSLDASSPQASVLIHPGFLDSGRMTAMSRQDRGKPIRVSAEGGGIQPRDNWVRVKREGSLVSMYYSANGTRWEWLDTVTLPLEAAALVGIAVSSYNPVIRVVAGVRSYQVQTNVPSTVALNSVKNSAQEGTTERAVISFVSSKNGPLEVPYTLRDAAANGVLYESISGTLSIPEGTNVAFLEFVPINNSTSDPPHVATVTVTAAGVAQGSASAVIFDDDARGVGLKKESYVTIPGTAVADLLRHYRYPGTAQLGTVPVFESTSSQSGGQILSGYLTPPTSGQYVFYLASANGSELWLSSDSNPENEVKIAEELSANTKRNWAGYGSQTHISAPILLTEGKWYSVKAIHKSGLGSPHLAVTWKLPGGEAPENQSAPIGGEFLSWTIPSNAGEVGSRVLLTRSNAGRLLLLSENSSTNRFQLEASTDLRYWQTISLQFSGAETELLTLDPESGTMAHRFYRLQQE